MGRLCRNGDIWATLAFSAAVAIVIIVLFATSGCVQPYPAESKSMGTQPLCIFVCIATVQAVEDNTGDGLTPTVGTATTGGGRSRSTVIEGDASGASLY